MFGSKLDKPVETLAINQSLQTGADHHIRRWLTSFGISHETQRRCGARRHAVANIGLKRQTLAPIFARDIEIHCHERRVVNRDPNLLDRSNQKVLIPILAQNRRKQTYQPGATDRCALIEPCAVARDPHVQIAAEGWVP